MLKFLNGRLAGLMMSGSGTGDGGGGGGDNAAFIASLPETLRAHPAFKDVTDVGALATRYADAQKPFAEQLPEDIRNEAYFKDIKDLGGLAKTAYNQAKMIGADKNAIMSLPKGPDDKDGYNAIYAALGRPESADKYVVPKLDGGRDYTDGDKAFQKAVLPVLHEAGVTQAQLDKIAPALNSIGEAALKAQVDARTANGAKAAEALRSEWGAAYDQNVGLAKQALAHYGSPELVAELESTGADGSKMPLGDSPQLTRLFAKLGGQLKEDGLVGKGGSGNAGELSPAEASQQINAKQGDTKFMEAYTRKDHPGHADAVSEMSRLYKFANPA